MRDKVVLLGYMGCGKSTIGKELAIQTGHKFIDLDEWIESREEMSITQIFEKHGSIYFRKIERLFLEEVLTQSGKCLIALGGGTPCYYNNMELINLIATSVYIQINVPSLTQRLWKEKDSRPLIAGIDSIAALQEFTGKHLFERNAFYQEATITVTANEESIEEVVEKIRKNLA
jgi:shikimate kinase